MENVANTDSLIGWPTAEHETGHQADKNKA